MKTRRLGSLLIISTATVCFAGCNGADQATTSATDGTGSEVAITAVGGVATSSEALLATRDVGQKNSLWAALENAVNPVPSSWAVPSCDWDHVITACSGNNETLNFDSCSSRSDRAISMRGSETLFWTGAGCCTTDPLKASSLVPCSFTRRTVNQVGESDPLVRSVGAHSITLDTESSSGFSEVKSGGFTVTCQGTTESKTCDGQRQVAIQGAHYMGNSGRSSWDHTVSTDDPLVIQGHGEDRKVLSGKIRVQHNQMKVVSVTTVTSALTFSDDCCFPTGGSVSTEFFGGAVNGKVEVVNFGPGCGKAMLKRMDGEESGFSLQHCL